MHLMTLHKFGKPNEACGSVQPFKSSLVYLSDPSLNPQLCLGSLLDDWPKPVILILTFTGLLRG